MPDYILRRYVFSGPGSDPEGRGSDLPSLLGRRGGFAPPLDVCETAEAFEVRVEIAGVDPQTVEVLVGEDDRTVTIAGHRQAATPASRARYLNLEVQYGPFARRLHLPESVDREGAAASYADGFLVLRLPKLPSGGKRRIPVEGGGAV
jgi:HSP20 family protein